MTAAATAGKAQSVVSPQARLGRVLHGPTLGGFRAISDCAACLMPLLEALGWEGTPRQLAEALPHYADTLDMAGLRGVLANLNYKSRAVRIPLSKLDTRLLPCLFQPDRGPAMVLLRESAGWIKLFNGATSAPEEIDARNATGMVYVISRVEPKSDRARSQPATEDWFATVARRFRALIWQMAGITFLTSLLALVVPLFIVMIYDRVIPSRSSDTLLYLSFGVTIALAADGALRLVRARLLGFVGGRIDMILGGAAFQHILHLPVVMIERAPIGAQLIRLKQFESVREFFTGPLAGVFLDLPFVLIFVAVIALVAGPLAWIPVILISAFLLLGLFIMPPMRHAVAASGETRSKRQTFVIEMLSNLRTIKNCGAEAIWSQRHRDLSAGVAMANFRNSQLSFLVQTLAQLLMLAAGIATLTVGTLSVMAGDMTIGVLIASMALTWRVLAPLQTGFLSLTRLEQVRSGVKQLNMLIKLAPEREPDAEIGRGRNFTGEIAFNKVSLRYSPSAEPAMLGVSFEAAPGQLIAITGSTGAGKSTLLKLIAGLYKAQAGTLLLDGIDIRQIPVAELRDAIAYVPQTCHIFHGTIAQNLRLANPTAGDADLARAALDADLLDCIMALPQGFETRLTDRLQRQLPSGFQQRLMLARAYVKQATIYLLDEPANNLDREGDAALMRKLQKLRGQATIFLVTHRSSHMRLADRLLYLHAGQVVLDGPPASVLSQLNMA